MPRQGGSPVAQQPLEVKTASLCDQHAYQDDGRPVDALAEKVPGWYEAKARRLDAEFCGTPRDEEGPVLRRLRELPPIWALAFGAFGEWSRGVDRFVAEVSHHASLTPERFGCCHGPEQARGVIAGWMRKRLGRVALRGCARVRLTALQVVARTLPGPETSTAYADRHAPGVWDEWDDSGNHVWIPHGG